MEPIKVQKYVRQTTGRKEPEKTWSNVTIKVLWSRVSLSQQPIAQKQQHTRQVVKFERLVDHS
jgi:hypothetical protein